MRMSGLNCHQNIRLERTTKSKPIQIQRERERPLTMARDKWPRDSFGHPKVEIVDSPAAAAWDENFLSLAVHLLCS